MALSHDSLTHRLDIDFMLRHEYKYDMREIGEMPVWERTRMLKQIIIAKKEEADRLRQEQEQM